MLCCNVHYFKKRICKDVLIKYFKYTVMFMYLAYSVRNIRITKNDCLIKKLYFVKVKEI